jgi:hypothetical protein
MNIFKEHPEYKSFFINPNSKHPLLKEGSEFMYGAKWTQWSIDKRQEFFQTISDWFWKKGSIEIDNTGMKATLLKIQMDTQLRNDIKEIQTYLDSFPTDKEKYLYLLKRERELELYLDAIGMPKGERGFDDQILSFLNKEIEFYKKKIELLPDEPQTESKKRTPPKPNEHNKPVLTQKQTAILFKLFKDHNLFVIQGLKKNRYEEIISQLTGYSRNTLHRDLSIKDSDLPSISDKPEDYQKIISELETIISELKENIVK